MGEYWKPVNLTRKEFIHPHHVDCGLKLGEWNNDGSRVLALIQTRWSDADDVRAVSDYGGKLRMSGSGDDPWPEYSTLADDFTEITDGK